MGVPVQTFSSQPIYQTMLGTDIDAGDYSIVLSGSQCNLVKGFSIQTGTLTAMTVVVLDSLDGQVWVDNTPDYAGVGVTSLCSNKLYKCDLHAPARYIKIQATRSNPINAVDLKVLAPNR